MLQNWFKIFWFHTLKNKVYFLLTVLSLALGIAGVILSILFYKEQSSFDSWNPNRETVFVVETQIDPQQSWMKVPTPLGAKLKEISPHVKSFMYMDDFYRSGILIYKGKTSEFDKLISTQSSFFEFFPFKFSKGNLEKAFKAPYSMVVKDSYATYLFGDLDPIGQVVSIGETHYTVSGIYTQEDTPSSVNANLIVNDLDQYVEKGSDTWDEFNLSLWLKLKDAKDKDYIEGLILDLSRSHYLSLIAREKGVTLEELTTEKQDLKRKFVLHSLKNQRMISKANLNATPERAASIGRIKIMSGLAILILLLATFNYINLTLVKTLQRGKEVGVRKTLGASFNNLIIQSLFETFLMVGMALFASLVIIEFLLPWLRVFLQVELKFSWAILPLILIILVSIVCIVGLLPALFIARIEILEVFKSNVIKNKRGMSIKNTLMIFQFLVACFFMIGTYIVYKQVAYMLSKDLGFSGEQVIVLPYHYKGNDLDKVSFYQSLKQEISNLHTVEQVTAATVEIASMGGLSYQFKYKDEKVQARVAAMDYNFLEVYDIGIKQGRGLLENLASDSISNILVNEQAARLMQESEPIGKEVIWSDKKFTIVGVVQDFNLFALNEAYPAMIFFSLKTVPSAAENINAISVKIHGTHLEKTIAELESIWNRRDLSRGVFKYEFADKSFAKTFKDSIEQRNIFLALSVVVISIALLGLYSLASYSMNSRLKEISIRKVLGANTKELLIELSIKYVWYCLIGFALAVFPSFYIAEQWLENYAFRIQIQWDVYIICLMVILSLTLTVVCLRAYGATKVDALKYLKHE